MITKKDKIDEILILKRMVDKVVQNCIRQIQIAKISEDSKDIESLNRQLNIIIEYQKCFNTYDIQKMTKKQLGLLNDHIQGFLRCNTRWMIT
jgi:hypothetical protein